MPVPARLVTPRRPAARRIVADGFAESHDPVVAGNPIAACARMAAGLRAMPKPHPLKGPNRFKLGVFSTNADGGLAITTVPERWRARWDDNLNAVGIADRAGLEFVLPIARWRGFGGKTHVREWSFETFTWAAGLASATQQIGLFMTVHVPLVHPVYAAKALATVDHISHGRAGLNIVCGWNPDEFAMFGVALSATTPTGRRPNGSRSSSAPTARPSPSTSTGSTTSSRAWSAARRACRRRGP